MNLKTSFRVLRGGAWINDGSGFRSAYRGSNAPAYRNNHLGFRVAAVQVSE